MSDLQFNSETIVRLVIAELRAEVERLTQSLLIERGKLEKADEENERLQERLAEAEAKVAEAADWFGDSAARIDTMQARLAEKDETISRMQGLLETCDAGLEALRARLVEQEKREQETVNQLIDKTARLAVQTRFLKSLVHTYEGMLAEDVPLWARDIFGFMQRAS